MPMRDRLRQLQEEIQTQLGLVQNADQLEALRVKYLGRRGAINDLFKELAGLAPDEKKLCGEMINRLKQELTTEIAQRQEKMATVQPPATNLLLPGAVGYVGHQHPLTRVLNEIVNFFALYGFSVATGPEIEYDWYNFEALNIPHDHPARDMFSSMYIKEDLMLRSHTSPIQIRVMEKNPPPIKIICPGRCYRFDPFDASHSPVFHQVEALYVDEGVSFGELKWLLAEFVRAIFGPKVRYDFRPSFFPFTEPSAELAISCTVCGGDGCSVCGNSGWLEMLGCGMVHPQVLKNVKINPRKYTGYALGMGVERVAMIKYVIDDIRVFYNNDIRFLEQF